MGMFCFSREEIEIVVGITGWEEVDLGVVVEIDVAGDKLF